MMQLLSPFVWSLPFVLLAGGVVMGRVLGVPVWKALLWGLAPLLMLTFDTPFVGLHPFMLLASGWAALCAVALGRKIGEILLGLLDIGGQVTRLVYGVATVVVVLGITVTLFIPSWFSSLAPSLQSACAFALVTCAVFGLTVASAKVIRSLLPAAVWGCALLLVSTEAVLDRISPENLVGSVGDNAPLVPKNRLTEFLDSAKQQADRLIEEGKSSFVFLGGTASIDRGELHRLQESASRAVALSGEAIPSVQIGGPWLSVDDLRSITQTLVAKLPPSLFVVSGWTTHAVEGWNAFGIPGLSEREAASYVRRLGWIQSIPFLESLLESRVYRSLSYLFTPEDASASEVSARVPPREFGASLDPLIRELIAGGHAVVLYAEHSEHISPVLAQGYLDELRRLAQVHHIGLVESTQRLGVVPEAARIAEIVDEARRHNESVVSRLPKRVLSVLSGGDRSVQWVSSLPHSSTEVTGKVAAPGAGKGYFKIVANANGNFLDDRRLQGTRDYDFRFPLSRNLLSLPILDVQVFTIPSPGDEEDRIGTTDFKTPLPLLISVSHDGPMFFRSIGLVDLSAGDKACAFAAALDLRTGAIHDGRVAECSSASLEDLSRFIRSLPWGTPVAFGARSVEDMTPLHSALRYIGVAESEMVLSHTFAAFGVSGIGGSKALVHKGLSHAMIRRGSDWGWRIVDSDIALSPRE